MLAGKRILLIIGGGIAAYKGLDLIRRLRERGVSVTPVMTSAAEQFVTPLSVAALAGEKAAVIFVEHDMEVVTRYADRVLAFYSGDIIADDTPERVLADPKVQEFVTGTAR